MTTSCNRVRNLLKNGAAFAGNWLLRMTAAKAGAVVVYHEVSERHGDPASELVPPMGRAFFERQLAHLKRRYRPVRASELMEAVETRRRGGRFPVSITFDDDLPSHVAISAPALTEAGVPASFFLTGASLHQPHRFWWERLQDAARQGVDIHLLANIPDRTATIHDVADSIERMAPAARDAIDSQLAGLVGPDPEDGGLRTKDVASLVGAGFELGFHTRRHYRLTTLDSDALSEAMREGREELERLAGRRLNAIAYPHGQADRRVAQAAATAGFDFGFAGRGLAMGDRSDPLLIERMGPSYTSVTQFRYDLVRALRNVVRRRG
jgi:peptidoglycan/xylan/chitin deacetylase (PgdA/CDA1 family)